MPDFRDESPISAGHVSLAGLQAELASGWLSSAALTGFYLQRIDHLNPALHAVITVNLDAPAEAEASDAARAANGPRGPLEGIPVLTSVSRACRRRPARPRCSAPNRPTLSWSSSCAPPER
jgi:hypothetical protein